LHWRENAGLGSEFRAFPIAAKMFCCCTEKSLLKWSCFLGQFYGLSKMHLVCVHAAFRSSVMLM
jgi:hypothetical protein